MYKSYMLNKLTGFATCFLLEKQIVRTKVIFVWKGQTHFVLTRLGLHYRKTSDKSLQLVFWTRLLFISTCYFDPRPLSGTRRLCEPKPLHKVLWYA